MPVDSLAALVVEWDRKHYAAPASSAAGFVNAGMPEQKKKKREAKVHCSTATHTQKYFVHKSKEEVSK